MGAKAPKQPDWAGEAVQAKLAEFEASTLALAVDAAAKAGEKITINGVEYDFTGKGDADVAAEYSKAMAETMLQIQQEYGEQYIDVALNQLKLADPEAFEARDKLWNEIKTSAGAQPDRPIAEKAQTRAKELLEMGSTLTPEQEQQITQGTRGSQARRGNFLGNAAISQEARDVNEAGQMMKTQRQNTALQYLTAGVSPEDVEYRRTQQAMSDISSFLHGTTPTSQFRGLSSAGGGAAPTSFTNYGYRADTGNVGRHLSNQLDIYNSQSAAYYNQVNPWVAGIGTGIGTVGAIGSLGGIG